MQCVQLGVIETGVYHMGDEDKGVSRGWGDGPGTRCKSVLEEELRTFLCVWEFVRKDVCLREGSG